MDRLAALALVGWLALPGCGSSEHCPEFSPADADAIADLLSAQRDAWNRGDLEDYMKGYEHSPKLVFTSGAKVRVGWEQTLEKYRARYGDDASTMGKLEFEILDVRGLGGDGAIAYGRWHLRDTPQAGSGIFSLALVRTPAGWKVVHDHTSADPGQ